MDLGSSNQPEMQLNKVKDKLEGERMPFNSLHMTGDEVDANFVACEENEDEEKAREDSYSSYNQIEVDPLNPASVIFIKEEQMETEDITVKIEPFEELEYGREDNMTSVPTDVTTTEQLEGGGVAHSIKPRKRFRPSKTHRTLKKRAAEKSGSVSRHSRHTSNLNTDSRDLITSEKILTSALKGQHQHPKRARDGRTGKESGSLLHRNVSKTVKKKKRKYDENYIEFGFVCLDKQDSPRPQCVLCSRILANGSMKPSSLKRHLQTKHPDCVAKPREYFQQMRETMRESSSMDMDEEPVAETQGVFDIYQSAAEKIVSVSCGPYHNASHGVDPNSSPTFENAPESAILKAQKCKNANASTETKNESSSSQRKSVKILSGKKRNLIRKYDENYIEFGFSCLYKQDSPRPQCVLCFRILANESMRPSNLKRHLQTNHPDYVAKPREFFQRLLEKMRESPTDLVKETSFSRNPPAVKELSFTKKALMASYLVSLRIAKSKKAHVIGKTLIQPAAIEMCEKMLGKDAAEQIKTIPLSNTTVRRRIGDLAEDVKIQLIEKVRHSPYFALLFDESTDIANIVQIFCYVRYTAEKDVVEDLLFYKEVSPLISGTEIFELSNNFIANEGLEWSKCIGLYTDSNAAITGESSGFVHRVHDVAPHAKWTHCFIKREALASIDLAPAIHETLNTAVKVVNFIKLRLIDSQCFAMLCEEMGDDQRHVLLNTEVRWLSRGNVLRCLFNIRDDVRILLDKSPLAEHFGDPKFLAYLAYLSAILGEVNSCYLSLQGSSSTLIDLSDQIGRFMAKIDLWKNQINTESTELFSLLDDFLAERRDTDVKASVLKNIRDHLTALKVQLLHNFRGLCSSQCDWVRNPFAVTVESVDNLPVKAQEDFIDLLYDHSLQMTFSTKTITQFWVGVSDEYPKICNEALKLVIPFASTCLCEAGFSAMAEMKSKFRNRLAIASDLRLCLTNIEPNIRRLCEEKQAQPSH